MTFYTIENVTVNTVSTMVCIVIVLAISYSKLYNSVFLFVSIFWYPHATLNTWNNIIPPLVERGLYCNHLVRPSVCPSVHTFVTDISASTGRNDFIFDIWLWYGDLYRVSPFQVYRTSTSCLPCDLQMNEWGYS